VLIAAGVVVFLLISAVLTRWLALENDERNAVVAVLVAEARGDAAAMLAQLHDCTSTCRRDVAFDARKLKRPGRVQILAYHSGTAYVLTTARGLTRVAWKSSLGIYPVVQCVAVRRSGNAITGLSVTILSISRPIPDTADC
jgi:hypothetical protein